MRGIRELLRRIGLYRNIRLSYNVRVRARDKDGFIVQEHKGKNIFLDEGRNWLLKLLSYDVPGGGSIVPDAAPPDTYHEKRMAFIGLGVGGREQTKQAEATALYAANPGYYAAPPTFNFDDTDPAIDGLEAPLVYNTWAGSTHYPLGTTMWLKPISLVEFAPGPVDWVRYTAVFDTGDVNAAHAGGPDVYISEAAIYPADFLGGGEIILPDSTYATAQGAAYEAFPEILKSSYIQLEVQWTFRL